MAVCTSKRLMKLALTTKVAALNLGTWKDNLSMEKIISKPWGSEIIWAQTDGYVGKMLFIKSGERLSLQYHEPKAESLLVNQGRGKFFWEGVAGMCMNVVGKGEQVEVSA